MIPGRPADSPRGLWARPEKGQVINLVPGALPDTGRAERGPRRSRLPNRTAAYIAGNRLGTHAVLRFELTSPRPESGDIASFEHRPCADPRLRLLSLIEVGGKGPSLRLLGLDFGVNGRSTECVGKPVVCLDFPFSCKRPFAMGEVIRAKPKVRRHGGGRFVVRSCKNRKWYFAGRRYVD